MKFLVTAMSLFFSSMSFAQDKQKCDVVYDLKINHRPASIQVISENDSMSIFDVSKVGRIVYNEIKAGRYKILVYGNGVLTTSNDSFVVLEGQQLILNVQLNGSCLFDHPANYVPNCPKNHVDKIVPIVYGLVATKIEKKGKKNDEEVAFYGGCFTTNCDPKYYCKLHELQF